MSIRKKLYLNFGAILAMVVILFLVTLVAVQREHNAKAAASQALQMAEDSNSVRFQMMQNRLYLGNYLLSGDSREVERLNEGIHRLHDALDDMKKEASSDEQRSALQTVQKNETAWNTDFAGPLLQKRRDVDAGNATVADLHIYYLQKDAASWVKNSTDALSVVDEGTARLVEQRRKSDETAGTWTIVAALLSTLAALALGLFIAYRTSLFITEPLNHLTRVAQQIGEAGDLNHQIDVSREDEIGQLGRCFNKMIVYLKEMAALSEAIAGGNLSVQVQPRSKNDTLGSAFSRMIEGLRGLVRSVRDAASQVASASSQVAGASDESAKISLQTSSAIDEVTSTMHEMSVNVQNMVKSTQIQASSVSETSASIDEMVASIQRVADTAKVLLDISNRSREEVHNGITTMDKATEGLNKINTTISSSGQIIGVLGQRADDIGKIIEVIDDLAEQTNLLALNAAIEAARAGEAGRGFAVVASEVKNLASQAKQATDKISSEIDSLNGISGDVVSALESIRQAIQGVSEYVTSTAAAVEEQSTVTSEMSSSMQRAAAEAAAIAAR